MLLEIVLRVIAIAVMGAATVIVEIVIVEIAIVGAVEIVEVVIATVIARSCIGTLLIYLFIYVMYTTKLLLLLMQPPFCYAAAVFISTCHSISFSYVSSCSPCVS